MRLSQNCCSFKNNIPPSESDEGAEGHGTVVFEVVTTVPCSGSKKWKNSKTPAGTVECHNNHAVLWQSRVI
ncbi:MAG TPA: hypothetical protein DDX57_05670 [Bacteroidales bacterium]|nr:hypothetical protein [Bacteroidales bacterium]